jgi:hypothetical protein
LIRRLNGLIYAWDDMPRCSLPTAAAPPRKTASYDSPPSAPLPAKPSSDCPKPRASLYRCRAWTLADADHPSQWTAITTFPPLTHSGRWKRYRWLLPFAAARHARPLALAERLLRLFPRLQRSRGPPRHMNRKTPLFLHRSAHRSRCRRDACAGFTQHLRWRCYKLPL